MPLTITTGQLATARARVKKDKFRVLTLNDPDARKLPAAVRSGIRDTLQWFTEKPPRGTRDNFGFGAYQHWRELLMNPRARNSWASVFPPGRAMLAGLISAFSATIHNGEDDGAEREPFDTGARSGVLEVRPLAEKERDDSGIFSKRTS